MLGSLDFRVRGPIRLCIEESQVPSHVYRPRCVSPTTAFGTVHAKKNVEKKAGLDRCQPLIAPILLRVPLLHSFSKEAVS